MSSAQNNNNNVHLSCAHPVVFIQDQLKSQQLTPAADDAGQREVNRVMPLLQTSGDLFLDS